eukprot:gene13872-15320_t
MDFIKKGDTPFFRGEKLAKVKEDLLDNVKKEAKRLMEEAVTRKFIHADSSTVSSFCAAVEACLCHRLKKRVGGLFPSNSTESLINKIGKYDEEASLVARQCAEALDKGSRISLTDNRPKKNIAKINGFTISTHNTKHLWIKVALLERCLAKFCNVLMQRSEEFYENDAFLADQVFGPSLVWLLDGPCSLDYSKMKTVDSSWTDPSAGELVLRHRIYGGTSSSSSPQLIKPQLFMMTQSNIDPITGAPQLAREHVDSLHQNAHSSLMFGKNNVFIDMPELEKPVAGYFSIHKCTESLLLKWTPNPMMSGASETEKSLYWDRVLTIDMSDIVFLHCHQKGDMAGTVILIGQDGLQLPPLSFPPGSLLPFLTCLEQGLSPQGRLDPPLSLAQTTSTTRGNKNSLSEKIANISSDKSDNDSKDFVFRIINGVKTGAIDKKDLQRLLSNSSPKNLLPVWKQREEKKKNLLPKMHNVKLQRNYNVPARVSVQLAYDRMKSQIMSRAFYGWTAHCRYLKTVRTHLESLVLPIDAETPVDAEQGLTEEVFQRLYSNGEVSDIMQYVYHGGVQPSIRRNVWPYLLGQYLFEYTLKDCENLDSRLANDYAKALKECKAVEKHLRVREKDLLNIEGFATVSLFSGECTNDVVDGGEESDERRKSIVRLRSPISVDESSASDTLSDSVPAEQMAEVEEVNVENAVVGGNGGEKNTTEEKSEWHRRTLISSLIETKANLREIVDTASQRGAEAWKNLLKKSGHRRRRAESEPTSTASVDTDSAMSFDLEIACNKCGKKIIESRERVLDGGLSDQSMDRLECLVCSNARELTDRDDSPDKWTLRYPKVFRRMSKAETNPETGESFLGDGDGGYDAADGPKFFVINGENVDNSKAAATTIESTYDEELLKEFALNIHRIDKDVLRCDRNHPYFVQENLEKLRNVIMSYVWERLDVGYVQGMCDLCAPLLILFDDEAKAYGCFVKLMDRMGPNFPHGVAMDSHLANIQAIIQILDPELYEILYQDSDKVKYEDVSMLWETIWAASYVSAPNFSLFVAVAIVELYREIIIDNAMDFTDIIKFFNEMAERHDARAVLNLARNIVRKLQELMHPTDQL